MCTNMKKLIITADDYGYAPIRDEGIIYCFKQGIVRRSSFMVNGTGVEKAAERAKGAGLPLGLHLNLSEGYKVSGKGKGTLLNEHGKMHGLFQTRQAVESGIVDLQEVQEEVEAQITKFISLCGAPPFYVDGHQQCHILPRIRDVFAKCLQKFGIKETRMPFEPKFNEYTWVQQDIYDAMVKMLDDCRNSIECFKQHGISYPDSFVGNGTMGSLFNSDMTMDRLRETINNGYNSIETNPKICELMTHPGYPVPEGTDGGCGEGPDDFSSSMDRQNEISIICGDSFKEYLSQNDIVLTHSCI